MYLKEIQLFMARAYGPGSYDPSYEKQGRDYPFAYVRWTENRNMEEFLRLVGRGDVNLEPLITHRFPLSDGPQAYSTIMDPASNSLAVLLKYQTPDNGTPVVFEPKRTVYIGEPKAKAPAGKDGRSVDRGGQSGAVGTSAESAESAGRTPASHPLEQRSSR